MDRHTKNAPRKGTACVRRFLIPAALIAAVSLPSANGESTLRLVPAESRAAESPAARPETRITAPSSTPQVSGTTQIRIVSPANENPTSTQLRPDVTKDLWGPLSLQPATKPGERPNSVTAAPSPAPPQEAAGNRPSVPDMFGQLFASAMQPAQRPAAQNSGPVQQETLPAPMAEPLQRVVPIVNDPVAFAPVQSAPAAESVPTQPAAHPDLFTSLFTVATDSAPAPSSPTVAVPAPQTSRIVVAESAPAQPATTTMRIVIDQSRPADPQARPSAANTDAVAQNSAASTPEPTPTPAVAANQGTIQPSHESFATAGPDLFGGLYDAGQNRSPAPDIANTPVQESLVVVPASPHVIQQPLAHMPATAPIPVQQLPVQQPFGIVTEPSVITVPQYAVSPPIAKAPVAPLKPVQQPVGVVTEAPAVTVPQYAVSPPIAKAPAAPLKPLHQPAGIVTEPPAVSVPQFAASEPIAKAPVAPPKPMQQPVGVATEPPAIAIPQNTASEQIVQAPVEQPKPMDQLFNVPVEAMVAPAPQQVASVPAPVAPVAQPTIVARPAVTAAPQKVESIPEPYTGAPAPTQVATNSSPPVTKEAVVATPSPEKPLDDYRFAGVSSDAYRSASRFAGLQQADPNANSSNTFMLLPNDTFAYADTKQPAASSASVSPSTTNGEATLPEQLAEPQHLAPACNCLNGMPNSCPYLPGQSGAPLVCGVDCGRYGAPCNASWRDSRCIPWSLFGPGEYVGPARPEHVSTYYLRVNDQITLTYITSRKKEAERYHIGCGDRLKLEWLRGPSVTDPSLDREVLVQPDGTIALPLVGEVTAAGKTVKDLQEELVKVYGQYQRDPHITVTPLEVNLAVQDIISAVTGISGSNGQTQLLKVTPEGTIQASGLGSVYVQGLTLDELRSELEARYAATFGPGLLVSPSLTERATMYVFVGGEVRTPARYELQGPTTVMQAITLAGGWNVGGNLHQVVVFRRDENWCLRATKIDVRAPLYGNDPCPANDIWLRDNDLVIVPKSKILCATDVIQLYFTRGIYAAFPINYVYDFSAGSGIVPVP